MNNGTSKRNWKEQYRTRQDGLREEAMEFQRHNLYHHLGINEPEDGEEEDEQYSWGEYAYIRNYFENRGRRYGLLREFKNEGII